MRVAVKVPLVVIGVPPMESVPLASERATDVTVPDRQVPLSETQPPVKLTPLAKVEVAAVPVILRYVVFSPEAIVEVALLSMVVVAVPLRETDRTVEEALDREDSPETFKADRIPSEVKDEAVTLVPKVLFDRTLVPLI